MEESNKLIEVSKNKRYDNIDLLKLFAILMVIVLHTGLLNVNFITKNTVATYVEFALRLVMEGVPLFVMINGFLLINKEFDFKKHLKKTLNIAILLIIWSVIYIVISSLIFKDTLNFEVIINNIFTTNINNKYTGILWFLQNLITLYLLFPILKTLYDNNKRIYNYLFIIVAIFTVGINLLNMANDLIVSLSGWNKLSNLIKYINVFDILKNGQFVLYFMLGGYIYEYRDKIKEKKLIFIAIGLIAWIISIVYGIGISKIKNILVPDSFNYYTIFLAFTIVGLYALSSIYNYKDNIICKFIRSVGKNSLGIYLVHMIVIRIMEIIVKYPKNNVPWRLSYTLIIFIISYIIVIIINYIPILKKLIKL